MELTHSFTVPASVEETWSHFNDIESVASCFPGATVTSVEGDEFKGSCKVKLGPVSLVYNGSGRFVERDDSSHRFVVEAKGKDKRGNGTAGAGVTASFTEASPGSTSVEVVTDLNITGKPAQFGRGVIQDVSDKLLLQFVACLESRVSAPAEPEEAAAEPTKAAAEPAKAAAEPARTAEAEGATAEPAATPGAEPAGPAGAGATGAAAAGAAAGAGTGRDGAAPSGGAAFQPSGARTAQDDALDLGATVLPVLVKTYWKPVVGAFVALFVLRGLLRRRRRRRRGR